MQLQVEEKREKSYFRSQRSEPARNTEIARTRVTNEKTFFTALKEDFSSRLTSIYEYFTPAPVQKQQIYRKDVNALQLKRCSPQQVETLLLAFASPDPGTPGGKPVDIKKAISILIELGLLVNPAGSTTYIVYQNLSMIWSAYQLSENVKAVLKSISNDEYKKFDREHFDELLDLTVNASGFGNLLISKVVTKLIKDGKTKESLVLLAAALEEFETKMEKTQIHLELSTMAEHKDYLMKLKSLSKENQTLEFIGILIMLHKLKA